MKNKLVTIIFVSTCMFGSVSVMAQEMNASSVEDLYQASIANNAVVGADDHSAVTDLYKVSTKVDDVMTADPSEHNETIIDEFKQRIHSKGCRAHEK